MRKLTGDLPGVSVFQDEMLLSGKDANDQLRNPRHLFFDCTVKSLFILPSVKYLSHALSAKGIIWRSKVEAVIMMPPPMDISSLKSFLGFVLFYRKFIPNLTTMVKLLCHLTKKATLWKWGDKEQAAFED